MSVELITLGTAAGPAIRGPENGISSALVVGDAFYMIDFGLGCTRAAHQAGHPAPAATNGAPDL